MIFLYLWLSLYVMATNGTRSLVSDPIDLTGDDNSEDGIEESQLDGCPLPGFDPHTECLLCRLYTRDTGSSSLVSQQDSSLDTGLLKQLVRSFHQIKLTSRPNLIQGYAKKSRELGRTKPNLSFLVDITDEQVWRHYDEDHDECAHQFRDPMQEVERTLQAVLHQAPYTLCVELKRGRNKGRSVVHPQRLRTYLETVKTYTQLFPKTKQ